ncbi:hypothetical protein BUALT_Bualt01G0001700 [Buddleja alternifolia]|uniref:Uncharacterized protein n=1 Tax=Buddleja alternifolia TaxID=168488 RepID=A0AAV6YC04_9LAMI|nr:hypothetical protein BUALT_Bualt01G0001700 [Buddleja alternifolia]
MKILGVLPPLCGNQLGDLYKGIGFYDVTLGFDMSVSLSVVGFSDLGRRILRANNYNVDDDGNHVNGMVDYAGRPAKRSQSGYWRSACYIIGVGAAERFAYYGISSNLITYLTGPLRQPTAAAAASINIWTGTGPLAALLVLNYIQDNVSWGLGFGIPCISMAFALILFVLGTKSYRYSIKGDEKCALVRVSQVFIKAATNRRAVPSKSIYNEEEHDKVPQLCSQQSKFLNKALLAPDGSATGDEEVCTTREIEEAKALLNLVPIWVTSLAFAICLAQPPTLFTEQGITMDRSIGSSFDVPAASLQYIIGVTIILFIPIYDRIFVPLARTLTGTHSGITKLQRIGIGMFLCTLSMITAALVERKRLNTASASGLLDVPKAKVPMSFWWLIPQYIVYGVADVFTLIGLQELFYDEMPCGLKSVGLSIYISICGVGNFLSSFLICIIQRITTSEDGEGGWFSDNMNRVHLDYFYWLLAGLNALVKESN